MERALALATGKEYVCAWASRPGDVLDICLGFRVHGELRPVVVIGLFSQEELARETGWLLVERYPYHYRYLEAMRLGDHMEDLARMESLRDELACRRHVERHGLDGGLRNVVAHDLRNALSRRDEERLRVLIEWLAGLEGAGEGMRDLAASLGADNAFEVGDALLGLLHNRADG